MTSCAGYRVTLNERTVYTPPPLFNAFSVEDPNLQACIEQAIKDEKIHKADELKQLFCSNAGITSLSGIHVFAGIEQLNLADNNVQGLDPLTTLRALTALSLKNNQVLNLEPLQGLAHLAFVDLSGNGAIKCDQLQELLGTLADDVELIAPEQCSQ